MTEYLDLDDLLDLATRLLSIVNHHPLVDGNKRLGWLTTAVFLELNGASVAGAPNDAVYDLVIGVADGTVPLEEAAEALRGMGRTG